MDKFGIFNLLNSFLNLSSNSASQTSQNKDEQSHSPNNFLSELLSNAKSSSNPANSAKEQPPKASAPLQRQMLSTMKSHDEIIKRVNKQKP